MEAKDRSGVETGYLFSRSQELARWLQLPFLTTSAEDCCRLRPLSHDLRKEPQSKKPESDEQQRTDPADVGALGKKQHSDDRGSRGPDTDKRCIDSRCRQVFYGFGRQIVHRDRTNDADK